MQPEKVLWQYAWGKIKNASTAEGGKRTQCLTEVFVRLDPAIVNNNKNGNIPIILTGVIAFCIIKHPACTMNIYVAWRANLKP